MGDRRIYFINTFMHFFVRLASDNIGKERTMSDKGLAYFYCFYPEGQKERERKGRQEKGNV